MLSGPAYVPFSYFQERPAEVKLRKVLSHPVGIAFD